MAGFRLGMQRAIVGAVAAVAMAVLPVAARAAPMSFLHTSDRSGVFWGQGVRDYIFADGVFVKDTPAAFRAALARFHAHRGTIIVFNSPGGSVAAGLAVGRMIRKHGLWTEVGSRIPLALGATPTLHPGAFPFLQRPTAPPFPGYCYSSCTLAFLGGVVRSVSPTSDYGVHRFYFTGNQPSGALALAIGERDMAAIIHYVREMGVSADFAVEMAKKGPHHVTHLTRQRMAALRIITPYWRTSWRISQGDNNFFYLYGDTTDVWGKHDEIAVSCGSPSQRAAGRTIFMDLYVDAAGRADPASFAAGVTGYNLRLDRTGFVLTNASPHVYRRAYVSKVTGRLAVTLVFTLPQFEVIAHSRYLGFAFYNPHGAVRFLDAMATLDSARLGRFARRCLPPSHVSLRLVNSGTMNVTSLRTRVSRAASFGPERLTAPLTPGGTASFVMPQYRGCQFDLLATFADHKRVEWANLNLCRIGQVTAFSPAPPPAAPVGARTIRNIGARPIVGVFIPPPAQRSWGANLLARPGAAAAQIAPGAAGSVQPANGNSCQYDIKVRYAGGAEEQRLDENLCRISALSFAGP